MTGGLAAILSWTAPAQRDADVVAVHDPGAELLARLRAAYAVGDPDRAVAVAGEMWDHPWLGAVLKSVILERVAAAALEGVR